MAELDDAEIQQHVLNWIHSFIIELNICPFAKHVVTQNALTTSVIQGNDVAQALEELMLAISDLDAQPDIETTLLILPSIADNFLDYLDFVALAEDLMAEQGYEGVYQLATFHPKYCFEGVDADDASNYTNRSPYPMIHLLRESSIDKAIDYYGNTDQIPEDNIKLMHEMGLEKIKILFKKLYP